MSAEAPLPASAIATATGAVCPNCGAPLHGEFCYACGQPRKGSIRHLTGIIADFLDTVFNLDARIWRTLWPLYTKPGFLSNEYFAGRRVRYVTPLRLYFFLSIVAFLVVSATANIPGKDRDDDTPKRALTTEEETRARRQFERALALVPEPERAEVVAEFERSLAERRADAAARDPVGPPEPPVAPTRDPDARVEAARAAAAAAAANARADAESTGPERERAERIAKAVREAEDDDGPPTIRFGGKPWHKTDNPLVFAWLPDALNRALNEELEVLVGKLDALEKDPAPFFEELFSIAPQALFLILPLFAVLLKLFYVFKRRLYMEHMIVALHSHSFLCFSILVLVALAAAKEWLADVPVVGAVVAIATGLAGFWIPIYLLLMQRRVYRQNWFATIVKFVAVGICYAVLLAFGLVAALIASLVFV